MIRPKPVVEWCRSVRDTASRSQASSLCSVLHDRPFRKPVGQPDTVVHDRPPRSPCDGKSRPRRRRRSRKPFGSPCRFAVLEWSDRPSAGTSVARPAASYSNKFVGKPLADNIGSSRLRSNSRQKRFPVTRPPRSPAPPRHRASHFSSLVPSKNWIPAAPLGIPVPR